MEGSALVQLEDVYKRSNYAGAATVIRMARQEGLVGKGKPLSENQVRDWIKKQAATELFAARPPSKGTTVARHPDSRLQMDLVDYKHKSEKGNAGKKYLMLAQNLSLIHI